jgi:hypothetical protein
VLFKRGVKEKREGLNTFFFCKKRKWVAQREKKKEK